MKILKIILVTLTFFGGLVYFVIWYSFRTTSKDVSHLKPFSEIVEKELTTVQPCFIAINYEQWVKENTYILEMKGNQFSVKSKNIEELPIGTILKIKKAKEFRNGVIDDKSTYVLGSVYLKSLQKEVQFEFAWGSKNYGTDLPGDYYEYSLAPWQNKALDTMFNYEQGIQKPHENYNKKKENNNEKNTID